ncbi:MAG: tetratricopeptide repeat protein [Myxococcales bacterium]|nr:MAG: tetratricopeptide repeat protein [Myxococcales bacterium]
MRKILMSAALLLAIGCGNKPDPKVAGVGGDPNAPPGAASPEVKNQFQAALDQFVDHDRKNDWNADTCAAMAKVFLDANEANKKGGKELPEAVYNAGLSYQRCSNDAEAKKYFQQALTLDPKSHRAKTQLALYAYKEGGDAALESTIAALQQAVLDAEFQNTEALVNLAALQMKRGGASKGTGCENDLDCAKKNIQRALAVDDGFMPAFNQLAIYYLERAKEKVGRTKGTVATAGRSSKTKEKKIDQQQLELAALVCSQAIRKNPKYPAIHNTAGLIQVELGNINSAVSSFKTASDLDPGFFEAQMNYAAVNLSFRGFKNAEEAYRSALKIKPNDYDAHLGLALALRGQINDSNFDANVKAAQEELDKAKGIAPERPETYYNTGILTQEYKVKTVTDPKAQIPILQEADKIYDEFISKASSNAAYADGVKRAKERKEDIKATIDFIQTGIKAAEEAPPPVDQPGGLEGDQPPAGGAEPAPKP